MTEEIEILQKGALTYLAAFQLVNQKLLCSSHTMDQAQRWCWIDHDASHIPFFHSDLHLWAEYLVRYLSIYSLNPRIYYYPPGRTLGKFTLWGDSNHLESASKHRTLFLYSPKQATWDQAGIEARKGHFYRYASHS